MGSLYCTEWYPCLSEKDPIKFEARMIRWAQKCDKSDVMIFDKNSIDVGKTTKLEGENFFYRVELPRIYFEYINFYCQMCILSRVVMKDDNGGKVIYKMPKKWDGCTPWYGY